MKKKIVALCLCIALAVVAIGGATLAYFTDKTTEVKNTFTVGKVDIDLWETAKGDGTGSHITERKDIKVAPGTDIAKDPTVSVTADSEDCWLFVKMTIENWPNANVTYALDNGWNILNTDSEGKAKTFAVGESFILYREVSKNDANKTFDILKNKTITVSTQLVSSNFVTDTDGNMLRPTMAFQAFAIQKDNLTNAQAAWNAVQAAYTPATGD